MYERKETEMPTQCFQCVEQTDGWTCKTVLYEACSIQDQVMFSSKQDLHEFPSDCKKRLWLQHQYKHLPILQSARWRHPDAALN